MALKDAISALQERNVIDPRERQIKKLRESLFDKQREYIDDVSKKRLVRAGRRGGKTTTLAKEAMIVSIRHPGGVIPVVQLSRQSQASKQYVSTVEEQFKLLGFDFRYDPLRGVIRLPNGSRIEIVTGSDISELDKLRGGKYRLVQFDEAASFRPSVIGPGIRDIVQPALMDYDGQLTLAGTPGVALAGEFYKASVGESKGYSQHYWTAESNPHIPHFRSWLDRLCAEEGWGMEHPTIQREYLAQWVTDSKGLCYPFNATKNEVERLPDLAGPWKYHLGIDVGYNDSTAFVVWAEHSEDAAAYCVKSFKKRQMTPTDVAHAIMALEKQFTFARKVIDTGGIGKAYKEEIEQRFFIALEQADKRAKAASIQVMADDITRGLLRWLGPTNQEYIEEMSILPWNTDFTAPSENFEDHLCDAGLYAYKLLRTRQRVQEKLGAPQDDRTEMQKRVDALTDKLMNRHRKRVPTAFGEMWRSRLK